ncbi:GNAT family N-acetyltransferase [Dysgonomonas sp. ZJ709]|uniref:GNAT family N-acetyltransferase n=1 Tax=Dysgonomonas sp. ZJ709 TaxID=2709797 RepID=UPI0013EE3C87|nr:GNAT family N-acetyltransferase [Dysgonomonas sp. ZJ709]
MKFEPIHITLKNGKSVTIREATTEDAEGLITAAKSYLRDSDYLLSYEEEFNPTIEDETNWIKSYDNDNSLLLIATADDIVIATFGLLGKQMRKLRHTNELAIAIRKEWQNTGLGTALFENAIRWAKRNPELEILCLEVFAENEAGIALYKKMGFVEEGKRKYYYKTKLGGYIDNIIMTLRIKE